MILLFIILLLIYAIIGNMLIRLLDSTNIIEVFDSDETLIFLLGLFFPLILIYVAIKEVSFYIYAKLLDYYEERQERREEQMNNDYETWQDHDGNIFKLKN